MSREPLTVGSPIDRVDARPKVTGAARYAADVPVEGALTAVLVQSTVARGRVIRLDAGAAAAAPGVVAVLTRESLPRLRPVEGDFGGGGAPGGGTVPGEARMPLADDRVHYAGQHLAVVVADGVERARLAASLVEVHYEEEPPILGLDNSAAPVEERDDEGLRRGDPDAAFERAGRDGVVVDAVYTTPAEHHNPMEPSATTALWEGGRLTVYESTQWVVGTRNALAKAFGLPRAKVRVISPFVGGGFGCKGWTWPHTFLAAAAAKAVGRPVRLVLGRSQMFTSVGHRPPTRQRVALAAGRDGRLLGARHHATNETSFVEDYVESAPWLTTRVLYDAPNLEIRQRIARVNVATPTAMRAPGECPGMFALESAMDELAYALRMDPVALRLANHADLDPASGRPWSSKHLRECYAVAAERFGWARRSPEPRSMREGRLLVGWGMATALYPAYRMAASARAAIRADGRAVVATAAHDLGTGAYTVLTQVAADALGLPTADVAVELGDSSLPAAPVAGGSNTTASVSPAVAEACRKAVAALARLARGDRGSPLHGLPAGEVEAAGGRLRSRRDPGRGEPFAEVLRRAGRASVEGRAATPGRDEGARYSFYSFGAQFCEAAVDPDLAQVRVRRVVNAFDVGRVVNPKTARAQAMGGVVMGVGMALMEAAAYDPRSGRCVTDSLADYPIPVNADVGSVETHFVDRPDPHINPLGCRGIGEIAVTGVAAAVANAVFHATGRRVRDLPITPEKLL